MYYNPTGGHIALSPDGRYLVFVGVDSASGDRHLVVRALSSSVSLPLPGTEGALYPFWSTDSRYVGYFANGKLMKILATGGPAQMICEAAAGRGGTWNSDGVIVFAHVSQHPQQPFTLGWARSAVSPIPNCPQQGNHGPAAYRSASCSPAT